jgi:RNA polymerase subunit RPABC4/transcription elongation factor Spt4
VQIQKILNKNRRGRLYQREAETRPEELLDNSRWFQPPEAKFCSECGAAMEKSKACPNCKELNDPDAKFCDNCGNTF